MPFSDADARFMTEALAFARIAYAEQEIPIGAVVVRDGRMVGRGRNRRERLADPTHHAEIEALREAASDAGHWRLDGATLYATVEPCPLCWGAALLARVDRVVYGARDPKAGALGSVVDLSTASGFNHRIAVTPGVLEDESAQLLRDFFRLRREEGPRRR